jgi:membrane associated rhomboid family serine protease
VPIRLSPTVKVILIACFVAFLIQQTTDQFLGGHLNEIFALFPRGVIFQGRIWQLFTYPFLHADPLHLILNMMMLAFIASDLELQWGRKRFLIFYFFCAVSAGILYLLLQLWVWKGQGIDQPMVGASAAIYGCLMAYGLLFGERVMLFMMLFPMKAKHFIWVLAGVEFMSTVFSGRGGLSSAAHVGGMLAGVGYLWVAKARARSSLRAGQAKPATRRKPLSSKKKHLKLIVDNDEEKESSDDDRDPPKPTWH